jgi:[ribosomal protein S5]-alanine N-acetyltransferase
MAFFRTAAFAEALPAIEGDGVILRQPQMSDYPEWAALREKSREFLEPWEPIWPGDDLTRGAFRRRLKRYAEDQRSDQAYSFFIFRDSNVRRGVAQAGSIGYWMGKPYARQGLMSMALRALIPFCFSTLRLHRLEAACITTNVASIRLLEKSGFQREGYARQYLCINGMWQDHLLYARLKDDPPHLRE